MYYPSSISDTRAPPPPFRGGSRAPFPPSEKNAYNKKSVRQIGTKFNFSNHVLSLFHFHYPFPLSPFQGWLNRAVPPPGRKRSRNNSSKPNTPHFISIIMYNHVDSDSLCQYRQPILPSHLYFPLYCCRRFLHVTVTKIAVRTRERHLSFASAFQKRMWPILAEHSSLLPSLVGLDT